MSDLDLKNECMEDADIDITRYSNSELTQIREAMRMYAERKLKLFDIPGVVWRSEQLKAYAEFLYKTPAFQNYSNKDLAIDYCDSL